MELDSYNSIENFPKLEEYRNFLEKALSYYYCDMTFLKYFKKIPKTRYYTFNYALNYIKANNLKNIIELGTSRSFVDGRFEGCNEDDIKYWNPDDPSKWDWSAGLFTRVFSECLNEEDVNITTVDFVKSHIERSKIMTDGLNNLNYVVSTSEDFLKNYEGKADVIYLDTGDMTPVEDVALLQLLEAHIIVDRDLLNPNGLLIIDDVYNPAPKQNGEESDYGKAKYSIPYLLENDFEVLVNEYQVILKKK